ncbi:MAG: bacillithiol biosynthesis cysteine-adding enzyme BshC [Planctomycetes bacterium]|nr:bacillithiol biosynthesis cysteine-adding enzyme BshC [Planctomycetota bacterium]
MAPIPLTTVDAGNELGRRYLGDFAQVEPFFACDYRRPEHLAAHANKLLSRTWAARFDRQATVALLDDYARRHLAPPPVLANIARLAEPHCVCVLTGQQAGLGGGPLLTLYKALTAIKLARELEQAAGLAVVPVFWNASDDSDLEEVNRLRAVDDTGNLLKFRLRMSAGKTHVRDVQLPGPDDPQWREAEALVRGPFADRALALLRDGAGRDFGAAFTRLLHELLGPRGLIVIEPRALVSHPQWRRLVAFEIENRDQNRSQLQRLSERLEGMGLSANVPITANLNIFRTVRHERRHVTSEGRHLIVEGVSGTTSKTALLKALKDDPGQFTPNVLLRPLVQNAIFPTVAYVGGQAEIAYHALLKGLHRSAQVFMPALFPRLSLTLVDAADARRFDELVAFRNGVKWRQKEAAIVADGAQSGLKQAFSAMRQDLKGLSKPLEPDIERLEQRTGRALAEIMTRVKHEPLKLLQGGSDYEPMWNRYFPEDRPQERVISVVSALARYGPAMVDVVDQRPDVFDFHHHVAVVGG